MGNNQNKQQQQQQQQQYQSYDSTNNYDDVDDDSYDIATNNYSGGRNYSGGSTKRIGPKDYSVEKYGEKEVAALIITINHNDSYDALYQSVEQSTPDPNQYVSVYEMVYTDVKIFYEYFKNEEKISDKIPAIFKDIIKDFTNLEGENIVVNFECCGSCSDSGFSHFPADNASIILELTAFLLKKKCVIMFSDFSIKAMINAWVSHSYLGPNPFQKVGEFGSSFVLEFVAKDLIDCDFAQLQNVGELCENGRADVSAPGGTILYTVKPEYLAASESLPYDLKVLSIVTSTAGAPRSNIPNPVTIGEFVGAAGHVALNYKNGGKILASCGHWVSLVKLDVSMESALNLAEKKYGADFAANKRAEWSNYSDVDRCEQVRLYSNCEVQKSAPCKYKSSKFL